jgi:hypothetical protein
MPGFFGRIQNLAVKDGQLCMNAIPLIPQSETLFESASAALQFVMDEQGAVTHFILAGPAGEGKYDRKP